MSRRPLDFYETPPHYIAALLHFTQVFGHVYEPCAGDGAIVKALSEQPNVGRISTNDIDKKRKTDTHYDATREIPAYDGKSAINWIVTNPPFSQEQEIIEMCWPNAENLAFLARLSFLEPTEDRARFLMEHPPTLVIVLPRYSFRPNDAGKRQTDSVTCCWLVWKRASPVPLGTVVISKGKAEALARMMDLV